MATDPKKNDIEGDDDEKVEIPHGGSPNLSILSSIPAFTGRDSDGSISVDNFLRLVLDCSDLCSWNRKQIIVIIRHKCLDSLSQSFFSNNPNYAKMSLQAFLEKFRETFQPEIGSRRFQFHQLTQGKGDSIAEFSANLLRLSSHLTSDLEVTGADQKKLVKQLTERDLKEQLLSGINPTVKIQLLGLISPDNTFEEIIKKARTIETALKENTSQMKKYGVYAATAHGETLSLDRSQKNKLSLAPDFPDLMRQKQQSNYKGRNFDPNYRWNANVEQARVESASPPRTTAQPNYAPPRNTRYSTNPTSVEFYDREFPTINRYHTGGRDNDNRYQQSNMGYWENNRNNQNNSNSQPRGYFVPRGPTIQRSRNYNFNRGATPTRGAQTSQGYDRVNNNMRFQQGFNASRTFNTRPSTNYFPGNYYRGQGRPSQSNERRGEYPPRYSFPPPTRGGYARGRGNSNDTPRQSSYQKNYRNPSMQ